MEDVGIVTVATLVCGDGIMLHDEECDDRNDADGDGCSSECRREEGYDFTTVTNSTD